MRILVVGQGGREHALAWKLAQSDRVDRVLAAPGNPGIAQVAACVDVDAGDVSGIASLAETERIDLTVVGPEVPLVAGLADELSSRGLKVFGPSADAAWIEGSKVFCREFAGRHGIPMARGESFESPDEAKAFTRTIGPPVVVKADGLAAGKGVTVCESHERASEVIDAVMRDRVFGDAGRRVVVEEALTGREISLLYLTDGQTLIPLEPAQDYKPVYEGNKGPNTGGMGAYSPAPWLTPELRDRARNEIAQPIVAGLRAEGRSYVGCLYTGLFITSDGPKLIEVNCRFGDPETQAILPRLEADLAGTLEACVSTDVRGLELAWRPDAAVCVAIASKGYPGEYRKGLAIDGIREAESLPGVVVFHAGTRLDGERLVSSSGRVLNVVATGPTIRQARDRAYQAVAAIRMDGAYSRTDIAEAAGTAEVNGFGLPRVD